MKWDTPQIMLLAALVVTIWCFYDVCRVLMSRSFLGRDTEPDVFYLSSLTLVMDDERRESEDYKVQRLVAIAAEYVDEDSIHMSRGVQQDVVEHIAR